MQTLFPPAPSDHGAHQKQIGISSLSLTRRDLLYLKQFFSVVFSKSGAGMLAFLSCRSEFVGK